MRGGQGKNIRLRGGAIICYRDYLPNPTSPPYPIKNERSLTEGIIQRLEGQVRRCSAVKGRCSQKLLDLSRSLYDHALKKENNSHLYTYGGPQPSTDQYLEALDEDNTDHKCHLGYFCPGLSEVSKPLTELKKILETLP